MLIVNSLNPPNRYGNIAVTRVLFIFEKKCTMSLLSTLVINTTSLMFPQVDYSTLATQTLSKIKSL